MKKVYMIAAATLCGLAMTTSCTNDGIFGLSDHALEIFAECSGTKSTVNGTTVKWVAGDEVWINGTIGTVTENRGHWYVDGSFTTSNDFNLFYPATLATATGAENLNDATATVVFPSRYVSSFGVDGQEISLPMGARSTDGATGVMLKHLSAGLNVVVTNNTAASLLVDSMSVTSTSVNLSGQVLVTLSTDAVPTVAATGDGSNTVTVCFSTPVPIAVSDSKTLQMPVIPNASGLGDLTVKVYTHQSLASFSVQYLTFTNTKSDAPGLGRNTVASLPIEITDDGTEITRHILGAFAVSNSSKVHFSLGNLQYKSDEAYPWRFAPNQYDRVGEWNTSSWIDLFGWGTWTGEATNPLFTSKTDGDYSWNTADFTKESQLADASLRGFDWRTLSRDEWVYLINSRPGTYRYAKAIVHSIEGVIIFPDGFTMPAGVTINNYNKSNAHFNSNTIDDNWAVLETEGCVFLPAAGTRNGTALQEVGQMGGYHSSTYDRTGYDSKMRFDNTTLDPKRPGGTRWGNSVRLVRSVQVAAQ